MLVPFVRNELRHLRCPLAGLADLGRVHLRPAPRVVGKRPLTATVGRDSPLVPVESLGIGDVQLAAVTEEGQAPDQTRRALHWSVAFDNIPAVSPLYLGAFLASEVVTTDGVCRRLRLIQHPQVPIPADREQHQSAGVLIHVERFRKQPAIEAVRRPEKPTYELGRALASRLA